MKFLCALCLLASPLSAQEVIDCDWHASAELVPEPWEDYTRTFANGDVRVTLMDALEPGAAWAWLLILSPPRDEIGARQCRVVGLTDLMGFGGMDIAAIKPRYDAAKGLSLDIPVTVYDDPTASQLPRRLTVTINQSTGDITATLSDRAD